jgi:hypothetical protein
VALFDLGGALECSYRRHGADRVRHDYGADRVRGLRCIQLLRESLELRPPGHLLRDKSLHLLARAIAIIRPSDGSERIQQVAESISFAREALQLRPPGHPERRNSLNNLGMFLSEHYELSGDQKTLEELVATQRQVLSMCPPGDALRIDSLNNLAASLRMWFEHRGGIERLTEAIALLREASLLQPTAKIPYYRTLDNISSAILLGAMLQGRPQQFQEAISLEREALQLMSVTNISRGRIMVNLAGSLMHAFRHGHVSSEVIAEAIHLQREALHLRRLQDRPLDDDMSQLAEALAASFDMHKDHDELLEAISLQRQALRLRPAGHWRRSEALHRLSNLLSRPECRSWSEALSLFREALELSPLGFPNRAPLLSDMARCFLEPSSPVFDLYEGIYLLSEAHSDQFCHVSVRLRSAVSSLRRVEDAYSTISNDAHGQDGDHLSLRILELYIEAIGLLPRAANFGLEHSTRLQAVAGSDEIARNAAARALNLGRVTDAVEMLEEGRGVFWSQTLHLRAAGFDGVPDEDRLELERLLQILNIGASGVHRAHQTAAQREKDIENRRQLNEEAEALISRIRGYVGLERFLLPPSFQGLMSALPNGFVVIVNASKLGHHALMLHGLTGIAVSLKLHDSRLGLPSVIMMKAQLPRDMSESAGESPCHEQRTMRLDSGQKTSLEDVLALLWSSIAQPIIRKLGLQVRAHPQ